MTTGIRYDNREYQIGDCIPASRVWVDGDETDELLPGTSVIQECQDKYTGSQYAAVYTHKYLVEGQYVCDGEDDGELIVDDCRVIEVIA